MSPASRRAGSRGSRADETTRRLRAYYDATPAYHRPAAGEAREPEPWDPNLRVLRAHVRAGDQVLDLAGGAAALKGRLPACRYVACDLSHEALRQGGTGVLADARRLPFADGTFDVVLAHHALEHFAAPRAVLEEAVRVLAPEGRLLLCGPAFDSPLQPLPMLAHARATTRLALRLRLLARLARHELLHTIGLFRYHPLVLDDVASFHGVGRVDGDYDAVHPTQLHETVFFLESLGLAVAPPTLWSEHASGVASGRDRALGRIPILRWFVRTFPLVAHRVAS